MIDHDFRDQWGDHNGRDTYAKLQEIETVMLLLSFEMVSPGPTVEGGFTWIEKSSLFVVHDQQQTLIPVRRVADGFVDALDQPLAAGHVIQRMLGVPQVKSSGVVGKTFP